jgi:response regulator RpfG family c-di-GMP phosphodiesterase
MELYMSDILSFADEEETEDHVLGTYKVVIADDDDEIHRVTKVILDYFDFEGRKLEFIDTYSGAETKKVLENNPDTAVVFLDVVMEKENAGLEVVQYLRDDLDNHMTRVILRTGQPGEAPEEEVIKMYDINDYRLKTELTVKRLHTTTYSALRNYRDLKLLEQNKKGLEKIIKASSTLFEHNTLNEFLETILSELSKFSKDQEDMLYIREDGVTLENGVVLLEQTGKHKVIAGTGKFENVDKLNASDNFTLRHVTKWIDKHGISDDLFHKVEQGFIIKSRGKSNLNNYIYVETDTTTLDFELIELFLSNFSIALDNYILNNMLMSTQKEIVYTLAETVESHFQETGSHIKRIAEMMYEFSLVKGFSYSECDMVKLASSMHDLGKVSIPDRILKKPGKLTEDEYEIMKEHAINGYKILKNADLPIIRIAAEIAWNHHERFDGSGYPRGISGKEIPLYGRMMAIVDVYDAMSHNRIYKKSISQEDTLKYITEQKGLHFDPDLVELFVQNLDTILKNTD